MAKPRLEIMAGGPHYYYALREASGNCSVFVFGSLRTAIKFLVRYSTPSQRYEYEKEASRILKRPIAPRSLLWE